MSEEQPKKLDIDSKDIMGENLQMLKEMFPSVVKDGSIDIEALRNVIGDISEPNQEYYNFTWAGKSEAFKVIKEKTTATLKPMKSDDESVDFEETENIFIEGDNLEVLKVLQKTYHNSIKMIYIDPPYNKDKDFVYPDKWSEGLSSYLEYSKLVDEEGNITSSSAEDKSVKAGRKHSRWLTMMYPRLFLARNLLKDDGVIFISIDDDEVKNLQMICNEIFGNENFIAQLTIVTGANQSGEGVLIQKNVEYCLVYAKSLEDVSIIKVDKTEESLRNLNDAPTPLETRDEMGYSIYYNKDTKDLIPLKDYDKEKIYLNIEDKVYTTNQELLNQGYVVIRPGFRNKKLHRWRWGIDTFLERKDEIVVKEQNGNLSVYFKQSGFNAPKNIHNFSVGTLEVKSLFNDIKLFDYPKSTKFIQYLISLICSDDDIVLDFFAGSGTTAHSAVLFNKNNKKTIKHISVQLPEHLDKKPQKEAISFLNSINKPTTISEITKERIRRVGNNLKLQNPNHRVDTGFKVFKLSESNFKQWDDTPKSKAELQLAFEEYKDNVKEGSNQLDMLYEVILAKGLSLNSKVQEIEVGDKKMFKVDSDGVELLACFEDEITESALDEVIGLRPIYFICLDSSFKSGSALKTNSVLRFRDADILFETV